MQTVNDYERDVYNGDIGYVVGVELEAGELTASFDERNVTYGFGELDNLVPAYATTIHKSQGSEYPAVVIPVKGVSGRRRWSKLRQWLSEAHCLPVRRDLEVSSCEPARKMNAD